MKTIGIAIGKTEKSFKKWQEAMRKIIERAFGVLQIKFACLKQPCRKHSIDDAEEMMLTCMLLHNMMVEHRIENDEDEDFTNYNIVANGLFNAPPPLLPLIILGDK